MQPLEEWRSVVGWEGWYEVSNLGQVRRVKAYGLRPLTPLLKPILHQKGYAYVHLKRRPVRVARSIHSLVADAFLGLPAQGMEVNHSDGNKANNALGNLEYVTHLENIHHSWRTGLVPPEHLIKRRQGAANNKTKLRPEDVMAIRSAPFHYGFYSQMARHYGVTDYAIRAVRLGINWKHL